LVYINDSAGIVRSHIGELPAGSGHTGAARALVCTGAAAMYQDAAFPERSGRASDAYGEVLWTRFREGLADLVRRLGSDPAAAVPGAPSYSFPDAMILRDQGW
ncbi:MAG TPA: hypothetical protein VM600_03230, partial [Actinomycetota bacterium]|nr:hypothetical protein [Actinomycetota bacterium]